MVAFGSTGCRGSAGGLAPFVPEAQTSFGVLGHVPREIFKTGLSKVQFPAFPRPELVNREGL